MPKEEIPAIEAPDETTPMKGFEFDRFLHRFFENAKVVADFVRGFVDPEIDGFDASTIDFEHMTRLNTKFYPAKLAKKFRDGDMIWRLPRRGGDAIYLVLLLEFQATPMRRMAVRTAGYNVLFWEQLPEEELLPDGSLPMVAQVVFYTGQTPWTAPTTIDGLLGVPPNDASRFRRMQVRSEYHILDVGAIREEMVANPDTAPAFLVDFLRDKRFFPSPEKVKKLVEWLKRNPGYEETRNLFYDMLTYPAKKLDPEGKLPLPKNLEELAMGTLEARYEYFVNQFKAEGELKGRLEGELKGELKGRLEGELKGERKLLVRQLERRFGPLPEWAKGRIHSAESAALEEWGLRLLDAKSLEDVLR
jgi:hypothetical protein